MIAILRCCTRWAGVALPAAAARGAVGDKLVVEWVGGLGGEGLVVSVVEGEEREMVGIGGG